LTIVALLLGGVTATLLVRESRSSTPPVDKAVAVLRDEGSFSSGTTATGALADVAQYLLKEAAACRQSARPFPAPCDSWSAAAGYAEVAGVRVGLCTDPGRAETRARLLDYVTGLRAWRPGNAVPQPPRLPDCP
jgi:hypothetical protein